MSSDDDLYDDDFFTAIHAESYASARVIVPRVLGLTGARSIVDIGYGSGAWAKACRELGVPEVVGVDGAHVPADRRQHATTFVEHDLAEPLRLDRRFGLALCVEVAEHLPPERAPGLVADLTAAAPVVLFSAAVPGQGGTGHVNEQWSEYWVALFEAEGWSCRDAIRPWVRTNPNVAWWYRQNLYLAVASSVEQAYTSFPRLDAERAEHPVEFLVRPPGDVMTPPPPAPVEAEVPDHEDDEDVLPWPVDPAATVFPTHAADAAATVFPTDAADAAATVFPTDAADAAATVFPVEVTDANGSAVHATSAPAGRANGDDPAEQAPAASDAEPGGDEDEAFPEPPGWAAIQRLAGRARRRLGK